MQATPYNRAILGPLLVTTSPECFARDFKGPEPLFRPLSAWLASSTIYPRAFFISCCLCMFAAFVLVFRLFAFLFFVVVVIIIIFFFFFFFSLSLFFCGLDNTLYLSFFSSTGSLVARKLATVHPTCQFVDVEDGGFYARGPLLRLQNNTQVKRRLNHLDLSR